MKMPEPHPREEEATAYAFGLMDAAERIAFIKELNQDATLRALVDDLQQTAAAASLVTSQSPAPAAIRVRVLENIKSIQQDGTPRISQPVEAKSSTHAKTSKRAPAWGGWAAAALLMVSSAGLWIDLRANKREVAETKAQLLQAIEAGNHAQRAAEDALAEMKQLAVRMDGAEKASASLKTLLAESTKANSALQQQLAANTQAADELKQELAQRTKIADGLKLELAKLTKDNDIAKVQIAMLQSTVKDYKQGVAVVVWNSAKQEGILKLEKMPPVETGKDYQLWVVDPSKKTPVNAGVIKVDDQGFAKVDFKPTLEIETANNFAISVEKEGGVAENAGPIILLSP